jgi:hypothetical protein
MTRTAAIAAPMIPNPAPMDVRADAEPGTVFAAYTGDTTYTVRALYRGGVVTEVRCREFGWRVTNDSARFSFDHVHGCLSEGRWTVVPAPVA